MRAGIVARYPNQFIYNGRENEVKLPEIDIRDARPIDLRYGTNDSYQTPVWLLKAVDNETGEESEFAVENIIRILNPLTKNEIRNRI